jgi:D-arabinose 1-dehydrogenase-like Zn-dependent alcohol dehydrogenase
MDTGYGTLPVGSGRDGAAMQAIMVSEFGGPGVLELGEADIPRPRPGEVLVRVIAAGVGPWDASFRRGSWAGSLPYVPGGEFSGVVVGDTGADAALDDGAPVYGYPGLTGCYAQYVTCPAEKLAPIPGGRYSPAPRRPLRARPGRLATEPSSPRRCMPRRQPGSGSGGDATTGSREDPG